MVESIKDKVAIVGMGCTKFGERWDSSVSDLLYEAATEAFEDAGITTDDIQAAWLANEFEFTGMSGLTLSQALKFQYIPVTRVENHCASGSEALRAASYAVAAGVCDIALAIGVEKLKDQGVSGLTQGSGLIVNTGLGNATTAPGMFAIMATKYFAKNKFSPEEGKEMLARIPVKNHFNGSLNPKAHFRREITLEQVMNAPIIAWPLGIFDCCGVSDGAAAAIVVKASEAKKYRPDPVYIKALQICCGPGEGTLNDSFDYAHVEETYRAGIAAYAEAGIEDPRKELSIAEVHDCFSINEAVTMECLQFSPKGKVKDDISAGSFTLKGALPVNSDGGLKCFGHPIGASGLRMMYEVYKQLQGKAGERQVKDPKLGLTHNMGGVPVHCVVSCLIVGN